VFRFKVKKVRSPNRSTDGLRSGTVREIWMFHEHQDLVDEFWTAPH
jgi:hypothetical protein